MPIYKGNTKIVRLYKGSTEIVKRYKGTNLIFSALPIGYQIVEYIESTGTQYIDTNVLVNNSIRTVFNFQFASLNNVYNRIFGTTGQSGSQYGVRSSTTSGGYFHGETVSGVVDATLTMQVDTLYNIDLNKDNKFYIDNVNYGDISTSDELTGTQSISLFRQTGNTSGASIRLYSCKMYDHDNLIRNFVPCYRKSDNVIGLFDTVNQVFYTNAGSGTFLKGADI